MGNPEVVRHGWEILAPMVPVIGAALMRIGKESKVKGLFHGEVGKGGARVKYLVYDPQHKGEAPVEFIFLPHGGNATVTIEKDGIQHAVKMNDFQAGKETGARARFIVDNDEPLFIDKQNTEKSVPVPSLETSQVVYFCDDRNDETRNTSLVTYIKSALKLQHRDIVG